MNPYPLVGLNHFTVPVAIFVSLHCAQLSERARIARRGRSEFWGPQEQPKNGSLARQTENLAVSVVQLTQVKRQCSADRAHSIVERRQKLRCPTRPSLQTGLDCRSFSI